MSLSYYRPGDNNSICDRTGFKVKRSQCRKQWNGLLVRKQSWERRHPQDFAPRVRATQPVIDSRPEQPKVAVGTVTAADL